MLDTVPVATAAGLRASRLQVVLELLTQDEVRTLPGELRLNSGNDPTVTVTRRLTAAQGNAYVVDFRGQSLTVSLRGDYVPGQQVRLAAQDATGTAPATIPTALAKAAEQFVSASAPQVTLGAEARMISALLSRTEAVAPGAPLSLANAPAEGAPTPAALKQAVDESGVFYESHLAEWVQGTRDIGSLQREPQARIPATAASFPANATTSSQTPTVLLPMIREQMQALDTGHITWRGDIWPRQTVEMTISEETAEQGSNTGSSATLPGWTTTLKLEMPRLGGVEAVLQMQGDALRLNLRAAAGSAPVLKGNISQLSDSLVELGLKLVSVQFAQHGTEPS